MHEHKLALLEKLPPGWDGLGSQPMNAQARANYCGWLATIADERAADAEPMLTYEGHVRMEWEHGGHTRIAEIGPASLYMVDLAPQAEDDACEERAFDADALNQFFVGENP